jgi:choline monooxygenase
MAFDRSEWSLVPVAVETWNGFVLVNPDVSASPLLEVHPDLDRLAREHDVGFGDYEYVDRWTYDIPANWKVWVENATECYHCPTVHSGSFSDAFDTDAGRYQLIELGGLLCQFTEFNHKRRDSIGSRRQGDGFRFIFMFPSSFWAKDDYVAFTGMIVPTGVETCEFVADVYVRPGLDGAERDEWLAMYDRTLREDKDVVLKQQPGLRSNAIPYGRLLPRSESPIRHFHQLVVDALADAL